MLDGSWVCLIQPCEILGFSCTQCSVNRTEPPWNLTLRDNSASDDGGCKLDHLWRASTGFNLTSSSILVVDDVPENLKLVRILLSKKGFEVHTATTADDALEMARKMHPCLILADIRLPGMDGLEMTRRLKADPETKDITIVAITALAMEGDEQKALDAGCDGYITKPINVKTFPTLIRQYLK